MRLTRRDALAALAAAGVAVGGGAVVLSRDSQQGDKIGSDGPELSDEELATMTAAAEVLYPSAVENVEQFVTQYVRGRASHGPEYVREMAESVRYLDEYAAAWYDEPFAELDEATRREALREMNADNAEPVPDGSDVERVRYYVVNELLFALYATPTGGELVGMENPTGYPGGLASYQRGPQS